MRRSLGVALIATFALITTYGTNAAAQPQRADIRTEEALTQDLTPIPAGFGAIFVPTLTSADAEPEVVVLREGERIASGSTGQRIAVPPGAYRVTIGDPTQGPAASIDVRVTMGETRTLTPFFGAVRVAIVDGSGEIVAGDYVIATAEDRAVVARGSVDPAAKGRSPTFLLPEGHYVVAMGSSQTAMENAFALSVVAGDVVRYKMVTDGDRVIRTEFGEPAPRNGDSIWRVRWLVGATGSYSSATHALTTVQGNVLFADLMSRFEAGIHTHQHTAMLRLNVDQRVVGFDETNGASLPVRPISNQVEGELLYNYHLGGLIGPYVRALGRTSIFATTFEAPNTMALNILDSSGNAALPQQTLQPNTSVRLFAPGRPLSFVEDAGLAVTAVDNDTATLSVRAGPGLHQAYYDRGGYLRKDSSAAALNFVRMDDVSAFGAVATAVGGLRLFSALSVASRLDAFVPQEQFSKTVVPMFRWENTAALRLSKYAAVTYSFSLRRDDPVLPELETIHALGLRASVSIF
jgi:hypothetical protein